MPFPLLIPLIMAGASAAGGYLANRRNASRSQSTVPQLDPAYKGLQDALLPSIIKRLQTPGSIAGLREGNITNINRAFDLGEQSLENRLTARGLASSPVGNAGRSRLQGQRIAEIARMDQTLPLVQRDLENQDINMAMDALGLGRGVKTNETVQGNGAGGAISGLANMLGWLYGTGQLSSGGAPINPNPYPRYPF